MQSQKDSFTLTPIGVVRTVYTQKFGTPRQGALVPHGRAEFELAREWQNKGAFEGLEGFTHVWLISFFHQNTNTRSPMKIHPPRLLGKAVGVLASRSPHRPNDLGLTLARLEGVEGDKIFLSGIDLVDGTPIMDIKPYLGEADRPTEFKCGWADTLGPTEIPCTFAPEAEADLAKFVQDPDAFKILVAEVLRLDPRPLSYRTRINERFAIVLDGFDVHARFDAEAFVVISVRPFG